ncbi:hypothetical protein [Helicobacter cynogastricus]|uniref:hypothetical protein n=1 Tax=Helicobacter cynogastricus TaxID=329937 RepID=UPI001F459F29|nr:hypothetical protein [Helicobacter cynogastricus]
MLRIIPSYFVIFVALCALCYAQNSLERVQATPLSDQEPPGIALDLLFKNPLQQTPKIAPSQVITLHDITPFAPKSERFNASVLQSLDIFHKNNTLFIVPKSSLLFGVHAKLSQDKTYLRLEFTPLIASSNKQAFLDKVPSTKGENFLPWDYVWKVGAVLGVLLLILFLVKRKSAQQFLFPKVGLEPSVTFVKPLDATHKLVTIEVRNQLYLILLNANQSVVLDKIDLDFSLKKDPNRLKEDLVEETKERLRHSKLKGVHV